ncbi:MAG: sulfonate transport system substrate-binding protein [Acetobacterium sp.]|nr:sulfonate transport system substrate-binding protein [Acetobacterium sp.]
MKKFVIILSMMALLLTTGCAKTETAGGEKTIRIAEQYGIAYAPVQIMKAQGLLEKNCPGIDISWEQMSNTAAIREAMVADRLDAGFMAIPPFLIGWDNGMDWKIATGLSSVPAGLVTKTSISGLAELGEKDRIALPQPGSVQHILLAMACDRDFGNPQKLDNNLLTLSHPDGMNALLSGSDVTAHFTSTPYLEKELSTEGFHQILSGNEAFGDEFSFIVGVTTKKLHDQNPQVYAAFNQSVAEAITFINDHPQEAAVILSEAYELPEAEVLAYLSAADTKYSTTVRGLQTFSDFMLKTGYLKKSYESPEAVVWEHTDYED